MGSRERESLRNFRAFANLRQSSLDGLTGRSYRMGGGGGVGLGGGVGMMNNGTAFAFGNRPRASSSETNLRKLAMVDQFNRPGSALGLLQGEKYTTHTTETVTHTQ